MKMIQCHNVSFPNIKAILFDKNGTLEDSEIYLCSLAQEAARIIEAQIRGAGEPLLLAFGVKNSYLDPTGLISVASRQEVEVATAAYIASNGKGWIESLYIAHQVLEEAEQCLSNTITPLFDVVLPVLQKISNAGLKLGILSAATTREVNNFVTTHQLRSYFSLEMGVDKGPSKPDPRLFLQACQALEIEPKYTLMVGDSVADMQMARNANAAGSIGITWIDKPENVAGADVVINQLHDIQVFDY